MTTSNAQFLLLGSRPIRTVPLADGGLDILAFDWATGHLVRNMEFVTAVFAPQDADITYCSVADFYKILTDLRLQKGLPPVASPTVKILTSSDIFWFKTSSAEMPYRACFETHELQIRVNDWPNDPTVYTLVLNGHEIHDFDPWPSTWNRP